MAAVREVVVQLLRCTARTRISIPRCCVRGGAGLLEETEGEGQGSSAAQSVVPQTRLSISFVQYGPRGQMDTYLLFTSAPSGMLMLNEV